MKLHRDEGDGIVLLAAAVVLLIVANLKVVSKTVCI
jgi:hypothetical protein